MLQLYKPDRSTPACLELYDLSKGQIDASMSVISAVDKDHCIEERDHSPNQTEEEGSA